MFGFYRDLFMRRQNARQWAVPSFLPAKLRGDGRTRLWNALAAPLVPAGAIAAPLLAIAPPDEFTKTLLNAVMLYFTWSLVHFTWRDISLIVVRLQEAGVRRNTRPWLFSPFGLRDKSEFWPYEAIRGCGVVTPEQLGEKFGVLVVVMPESIDTIVIPKRINAEQVREELIAEGVEVKRLKELPEQARPKPAAKPRSRRRVAISAGVALVLLAAGLASRVWIHGRPSGVSKAELAASLEDVEAARPVRTVSLGDSTGVLQSRASADGDVLWARTKDGKHLVWSTDAPESTATIDLPGDKSYRVDFTPDGRRLVLVTGKQASIWRLAPCEKIGEFEVQFEVRGVNVSPDGARLVTTSMGLVNVYDVETGQQTANHKIPSGVIVATRCVPDGKSHLVVQPKAIHRIDLVTGEATPVLEVTQTGAYYAHGSISMNCRWAVLSDRGGVYVVDLATGKRRYVLDPAAVAAKVFINDRGNRIASVVYRNLVIWSVPDGEPVRKIDFGWRTDVELSNDGEHILVSAPTKRQMLVVPMSP